MALHYDPAAAFDIISGLPDAAALDKSCYEDQNQEARARPLSAVPVGMFDDVDSSLQMTGNTQLELAGREARTISSSHLGQLQPDLPASRLAEDQRRMHTAASVSPLSQQSVATRAGSQLLAADEFINTEDWDVLDDFAELSDEVNMEQVIGDEFAQHVYAGGKSCTQLTTTKSFAYGLSKQNSCKLHGAVHCRPCQAAHGMFNADIKVGVVTGADQRFQPFDAPAMPHLDGNLHAAQPEQQFKHLPAAHKQQQTGNLQTADGMADTFHPQAGQHKQQPNVEGTTVPASHKHPAENIKRRSCQLTARHSDTGSASRASKPAADAGGQRRGHKRRAATAAASGFKAPATTWLPGDWFPQKKCIIRRQPKQIIPEQQQQQQQVLQNSQQQPQHEEAAVGSTVQLLSQAISGVQSSSQAATAVHSAQLLPDATSQQLHTVGAVQEMQPLTQPGDNIQHTGASSVQNLQPMHQAEQGSPYSQAGETTSTHSQAGQTAAVHGLQQDSQSMRGSKRKRRAAAESDDSADDSADEDWTPKRMCRQQNTPSRHSAAAFPRKVGLA